MSAEERKRMCIPDTLDLASACDMIACKTHLLRGTSEGPAKMMHARLTYQQAFLRVQLAAEL